MAPFFFLRTISQTLPRTMHSVLDALRKNFSRLVYLPVPEPCSTTYSKLHNASVDRTDTWSLDSGALTSASQSLSLAQSLPYEILVEIFSEVGESLRTEWGGPFFGDQRHAHPAYCWVTLSHVCYRWRSVILDQSAFWARNVTSFSRAPRKELVRRARGHPMDALLHVWRNRRPFEDPDFWFLRDHIRGLHSLTLWLPEIALPAFGLVLQASNNPSLDLLASLEVTLYDAHSGIRMLEFRALPPLRTPSLRTAIFRDCFLFLEAPSQVTRLEIVFRRCYRANTDGALLTPAELSGLLASCTSLRHLHLGDELPLFTAGSEPIELPHLEKLALEGSSDRCAHLLEVMSYPDAANVRVRGHNVPSPLLLEDPVAQGGITRAVQSVQRHGSKTSVIARIFPGMSFELMRERSGPRGEGVHLVFEYFERGLPIIEVLRIFALEQLAVHNLTTDDSALNELCVFLTPTDDGADGTVDIPLPDLETLQLSGRSSQFVVECSASLLAMQQRRTEIGRPLKILILTYPSHEWPTIHKGPSIQVIERLLLNQYTDT